MSEGSRHCHTGIYGVVINLQQHILLIQKARGPFTGLLDLPGGSPEWHESLEQTLAREIFEETGLIVKECAQLTTLLNILPLKDGSLRHVGIIYKVEVDLLNPLKTSGDDQDSLGAIWYPINQISKESCTPFVNWLLQLGLI